MTDKILAFVLAVLGLAAILIFAPAITFVLGAFGGWILKHTVGSYMISGLNILFNTQRFCVTQLPVICGTLAMVGSYFYSSNINTKDND